MKVALICGVTGQDGAYLAELLLTKDYAVVGTSRNAQTADRSNLQRLGIGGQIEVASLTLTDFRNVVEIIAEYAPDEVYQLAGQSSVEMSFRKPREALDSHTQPTLNLLEAIRSTGRLIKLYHASSSECFGNTPEEGASEETPFAPRSPYAVAKAASHWLVANYRDAYGLFACSGILFNHESPLRPPQFVTRKIVAAACRIRVGSQEKLHLGNLSVRRDWGWAPEYVEAMWTMLQREVPRDYVIATGLARSLEDFLDTVFAEVDLDWRDHVVIDKRRERPSDISFSCGRPERAVSDLGWRSAYAMPQVAKMMVSAEREQPSKQLADIVELEATSRT